MQQIQDKQPVKTQNNGSVSETPENFKQSPVPAILSTTGKVFYGLSSAAILLSIGIWNRPSMTLPKFGKKSVRNQKKVSERQYQESQRLGTFIGLWAPTLMITGKVLEDASERVSRYEIESWERKQADKTRTPEFRARFFNR